MKSKQTKAIKTKATKPKSTAKSAPNIKVSASINPSLHTKVKKFINKNNISINALIGTAIKEYLDKQ